MFLYMCMAVYFDMKKPKDLTEKLTLAVENMHGSQSSTHLIKMEYILK